MSSRAETEFAANIRALLVRHSQPVEDGASDQNLLYADLERQRRILRERFISDPFCLNNSEVAQIQRETEEAFYSISVNRVRSLYRQLSSMSSLEKDPNFVEYACRTLSFGLFRPWHQQEFYTCADVFSRLGGIRLICQWAVEWAKNPRWNKKQEVGGLAMIMSSCWNFCSNDERSKHLLDAGILPFLVSLLADKGDRTPEEIRRKALGLLWSVIEYGDVQRRVTLESPGVIDALFHICRHNSSDALVSEMAMGSIHMCASNFHCVPFFALREKQFLDAIRSCLKNFSPGIMVGYVACLALGGFLANLSRQLWIWVSACAALSHACKSGEPCDTCRHSIGPLCTDVLRALSHLNQKGTKLLRKWLSTHQPQDIRKIESGHYVWRYMHPFSILLQCNLPVVQEFGTFAMANLAQGSDNRDQLVKEEGPSVPFLQFCLYTKEPEIRKFAREALKKFYEDGVEPMSLQDICCLSISQNFSKHFDVTVVARLPLSVRSRIIPLKGFH